MSRRKESRQSSEADGPRNPILGELLREKGFTASEPEAEEPEAAPAAGEGPLDLGRAGKIVLSRERKGRGGRTVTLLSAPGLPAADLERLARALRKALGCGSAVEEGKVVVQGDIAPRVRAWLEEHGATKVIQGN